MTPLCILGHRSLLNFHGALLHNISWTHEKAGRAREALEYAERYLVACRGTQDAVSYTHLDVYKRQLETINSLIVSILPIIGNAPSSPRRRWQR